MPQIIDPKTDPSKAINSSSGPHVKSVTQRIEVDMPGSLKRYGGRWDIFSDAAETFHAWEKCYEDGVYGDGSIPSEHIPVLAATAGLMLTRSMLRVAFARKERMATTEDMTEEIGQAFREVFGGEDHGAEGESVKL